MVAQAPPAQGLAPKPRAPSGNPAPSKSNQAGQRLVLTELLGGQELDLLPRPSLGSASSTSSSDVDYVGAGAGLDSSGRPRGGTPPLMNLRELFLPPGYPDTVTPDYLSYQLWCVACGRDSQLLRCPVSRVEGVWRVLYVYGLGFMPRRVP